MIKCCSQCEDDEDDAGIICLCKRCRKDARKDAIIDGVKAYAWMKDGVYYVGTTGKTLKQAIEDVHRDKYP